MTESRYIGVDLAWQSERNHTGMLVLEGDCSQSVLLNLSGPVYSVDQAITYIEGFAVGRTVVAIDAPLIIRNQTGQRPCETEVGRRYGAREASCHTSNLRLYPDPGSVRFADSLAAMGFVHGPAAQASDDRVMIEVYPHAGMVALFALERTLKYKKGRVSAKRTGLRSLRELLSRLDQGEPRLVPNQALANLFERDLDAVGGKALKQYEDSLDALFAAYLALFFDCGGRERSEVFGDVSSGYIVNPLLQRGISALTAQNPAVPG